MKPKLTVLKGNFMICQSGSDEAIPGWIDKNGFYSVTKTDEEISVVCRQPDISDKSILNPALNMRMIRVIGPFDLSVTGIIAGISAVLAENRIPVFVISTFNTDYLLVDEVYLDASVNALRNTGYTVTFE